MTPSSPHDARPTMDPGQRTPGGPAPAGQPAPLDRGVQQQIDTKSPDDAPLHAPDGQQPRQAGPNGPAGEAGPDNALEGLGKAITSPIRGAADDEEAGTPPSGGTRP